MILLEQNLRDFCSQNRYCSVCNVWSKFTIKTGTLETLATFEATGTREAQTGAYEYKLVQATEAVQNKMFLYFT